MHGDINLQSELGQGTTTTFWIPFNKSQSTKLGSPLIDSRPVPNYFQSDMSMPGCLSAPQSVVEDSLPNAAPPGHFNNGLGTSFGAMPPSEGTSKEPLQQEVDRKSVHVLIVEDKYVVISSRVLFNVHEPLR